MTKKLANLLEKNVDEKYFLSKKLITCFTDTKDRHGLTRGLRFKPKYMSSADYAFTITTHAGYRPTDNYIIIPQDTKEGYALAEVQGYKRFLSFLETSHELKLYYTSDDTKYSYVEVESLSKTEISGGTLTSELKLKRLSYWYKDVISEVTISVSKEGKIYPFTYPYKYSGSSKGKMTLTNNGYAKAPLKITIKGEVSNPEVIVTKDGIEVSKLKIYYESNNCTIVVDAFPSRQEITIEENNEKINA